MISVGYPLDIPPLVRDVIIRWISKESKSLPFKLANRHRRTSDTVGSLLIEVPT